VLHVGKKVFGMNRLGLQYDQPNYRGNAYGPVSFQSLTDQLTADKVSYTPTKLR